MSKDRISSGESEGAFNEFVESKLDELIEGIINSGDLGTFGDRGTDVIVEMDDIVVPTFSYGNEGGAGQGQGNAGPGNQGGKIRFSLPFDRMMELIAIKLRLPDLLKESKGKIKELSYEFKTIGKHGVILDKKRTFKQALKTSVATKIYNPKENKLDVRIMQKDKRFRVPKRVEKPKYNAVVFYMGDISYSTYGQRLVLEKRLVNFIQNWLDYNYGAGKVEHRFFVHDMEAYEVSEDKFFNVSNVGGTQASGVFDLVSQIAFNEYDLESTNFYAFYFGDGELFEEDAKKIVEFVDVSMKTNFNRIGIVEVQPSQMSMLNKKITEKFYKDFVVRIAEIKSELEMSDVIKKLFAIT